MAEAATAVAPAPGTEQDPADTGITPEPEAEGSSDTEGREGEAETGQEEQVSRSEAERIAEEKLDSFKKEQEAAQRDDEGRRAYDAIVQRSIAFREGGTLKGLDNVIAWAAKEVYEGRDPTKGRSLEVLGALRNQLSEWVTIGELQAIDALMNERLSKAFPDYKPSKELTEKAQRAWARDPEGRVFLAHPRDAWESRMQIIEEAARADERAKVLAEQEQETREKGKVAKQREVEGQRPTGPTRAGGNGVVTTSSRAVLDSAPPGSPEWRQAYEKVHGIKAPI